MLTFVLGCMVGGTVGVVTMCLCNAASAADSWLDETNLKK